MNDTIKERIGMSPAISLRIAVTAKAAARPPKADLPCDQASEKCVVLSSLFLSSSRMLEKSACSMGRDVCGVVKGFGLGFTKVSAKQTVVFFASASAAQVIKQDVSGF